MGTVIAAAIIAFLTTEMDDLLVLFVLFSSSFRKRDKFAVVIGKYAGLAFLIGVCTLLGVVINSVVVEPGRILGLLGFVPIVIGIHYAVSELTGEEEESCNNIALETLGFIMLVAESFIITIASGGDNVAVYISFFSTLKADELLVVCLVFCILQAVWCAIAIAVMGAASIRNYIQESSGVIVPLLFIVLGIYILLKDGTITWLFGNKSFF